MALLPSISTVIAESEESDAGVVAGGPSKCFLCRGFRRGSGGGILYLNTEKRSGKNIWTSEQLQKYL